MPRSPLTTVQDWPFGATGRRRVLEIVTAETGPWTQAELGSRAGLHEKGSVRGHLLALEQLDLVQLADQLYVIGPNAPLRSSVAELLGLLSPYATVSLRKPR